MIKNLFNDHKTLLQDAANGDEKAFSFLFYEYSPALLAFARKISQNATEAEEIIQNVFLRVWVNRDRLPEVENIKSWLYKFVANESLSYIRKKAVRERANNQIQQKLAVSENNTEKEVSLNELQRIVSEAVNNLTGQREKIFNMSRVEGLTIDQISEQLNLSPNTVKNTLVAALQSVRDHLSTYGYSSYIFILLIMNIL